MKKAIISGATGAIGTALIRLLISEGVQVMVLCRQDSKRISNIPADLAVEIRYCGLDQLCELKNETDETYDAFFHLAWEGTSGAGREDMYLQNDNIKHTLDAVYAAHRFHCKIFVGAGSQAEYGRTSVRLNASTPAFPESGYGMAKLCAGQMSRSLARQLGLKHIWMRVLSVYGPNDGGQSLVMSVIHALQNGETPRCTKGEQQWDYLYSEDAARAFYLAAERGKNGKIYTLGSGKVRPLAEYIREIRDVVAPDLEVDLGAIPYNPGQVMYLCADTEDLEKDTGWKSTVEFKTGIRRTAEMELKAKMDKK